MTAPSGGMGGADMLERVARAMQESKAWPAVFAAGSARELARAAIEAMREPTDAMVRTGAVAVMASGRASNAVCHLWRKMIDASLTQSTGGGE